MNQKQAQEIADDLAFVELGFIHIQRVLPPKEAAYVLSAVTRDPQPKYLPPLALPHLPRCSGSENGRVCRNPASYPEGLCPSHFLWKVGHVFRFLDGRQSFSCRWCGLIHQYKEHARHPDLKQRCPARVAS